MLNNIEQAKYCEQDRLIFMKHLASISNHRNFYIFQSFKEGCRQKEIANATGLSESTIKHIIAQQKKENQS